MPAADASHSDTRRLWDVYYRRLFSRHQPVEFLSALPAADQLATFRWLFPEDDLAVADREESARFEYLFVLAHVEEYGADRAAALASYRRLLGEFASKKYNSSRAIKMAEQAKAAIRRLGG